MIMEDEMNKEVTQDSLLYVDNKKRPLQVRMHTDENSEVCTIRFGNSYTLGVVTPQDLMALADDINEFAKQAYELHYAEEFAPPGHRPWEVEAENTFIQAGINARVHKQRMLQAMKSTAESGDKPFGEYDPDDPVNW
jgi:hypothetical protein|tara:strand:+ start:2621 stop:3031 length:411 start_codon:yes stop_codon:yes gene_type:complete